MLDSSAAELVAVGASPEEVLRRAGHWPFDRPITHRALVRHWARLARPSGRKNGSNRNEDPPPMELQGGGMLDWRIALKREG
jgi:hypothetical protein